MRRVYEHVLTDHLRSYRQMIFLIGPRQAGKTTLALALGPKSGSHIYLNWDNAAHRRLILSGPDVVARHAGLQRMRPVLPVVIFDEIHKHSRWKDFLKGFFDVHGPRCRIVVTGSARLDTFSKAGDSLMGRYFPYRVHPFSVAELRGARPPSSDKPLRKTPYAISETAWRNLLRHGGFPEPFLRREARFSNRWRGLRFRQLFREDVRDITRVRELDRMELLAQLLQEQAGQLTSLTSLSVKVGVTINTVRHWLSLLEGFYFCFAVRPWSNNVARALIKQPKYYLWDWSCVREEGSRLENCLASHLLKAAHLWTDLGLGEYSLHFVRDKQGREVDFLVCRDGRPWFLVEAKRSGKASLSKSLAFFQHQLACPHALQAAFDLPFVKGDCFAYREPVIVPAKTLMAQLV
ncbi:MAG: AAA family ATPase [Myxococcota bacterium]